MTEKQVFKVVSGNPTAEELAIIVALAAHANSIKVLDEPTKLSKWGNPYSHMRRNLPVGQNAWRQSAWAKH
jgi:hypothetical protein